MTLTESLNALRALLSKCREGTFYEDHDESLKLMQDADHALTTLEDRFR